MWGGYSSPTKPSEAFVFHKPPAIWEPSLSFPISCNGINETQMSKILFFFFWFKINLIITFNHSDTGLAIRTQMGEAIQDFVHSDPD